MPSISTNVCVLVGPTPERKTPHWGKSGFRSTRLVALVHGASHTPVAKFRSESRSTSLHTTGKMGRALALCGGRGGIGTNA